MGLLVDCRQLGNYLEAGSMAELAPRDFAGQVRLVQSWGSRRVRERTTIGQQRPCDLTIFAGARDLAALRKLLGGTAGLRVR